jgi:hypothetical protein
MVLVAKPGCGLREVFERFQPPAGLVKEWEDKSGVEVLILRQHTTRTSGYHTIPATVDLILGQGIGLLRNFAGQTRQQG